MSRPQLLFGSSGIGAGHFTSVEQVKELLQTLNDHQVDRIDTAALYPLPGNPFGAETVLGKTGLVGKSVHADTKILLTADFTGNGALSKDKLQESVKGSFNRLKAKASKALKMAINTLYCHMPDMNTSLTETVAALDEYYKEGYFTKLGLSNYPTKLIEEFLATSEKASAVKPTVFEGQYNALSRQDEEGLLPFLRKHGISFVGYSPLAGGFLTGAVTSGDDLSGTRFEEGNMAGMFLRATYDKPPMHAAVKHLQSSLKVHGLRITDASLRWLYYHSALQSNDGIILGANSLKQLHKNLKALDAGPLDDKVVQIFDEAWKIASEKSD